MEQERVFGIASVVCALALNACSPGAPAGVNHDALDAAVSHAIGDPASCLLIAKRGGQVVYRYNSATACDRAFAACDAPGVRKVAALLKDTLADARPRTLSCNTAADASRGVGWASGPIAGTTLTYAAMMEGERAFPGRMIADRLAGAFQSAKLAKPTS